VTIRTNKLQIARHYITDTRQHQAELHNFTLPWQWIISYLKDLQKTPINRSKATETLTKPRPT